MDKERPYQWQLPQPSEKQQLRLYNSFTRNKEIFIANDSKTIKWYSCGPTVYDAAHLGHARCYISFDIIRRILTGYFGYQVFYVMNITDIDDKIIKRARTNHLCDKFIDKSLNDVKTIDLADKQAVEAFMNPLRLALDNFKKRRSDEQDKDKLAMISNIIDISEKAFQELSADLSNSSSIDLEKVSQALERLRDPIADEQDAQLGHTVNDCQVFKNLAMQFEQEYFDDMNRLDVLPPSALTRVSEYIEEIGHYIVKLEQNGFAYRSGGSIYFDTEKFDADEKHSYAKLVRESYGHGQKDLEEGEGILTSGQQDKKKSPNDFALWKKSKIGEPSWQTQDFEAGRPGWHIECSVMASNLLGENFDIHSGGHDLKFPHHDNEIAQAEAYYNTGKNWVNYFIHSGHLNIQGKKMSKSLKNFTTIREALKDYSSRQLRFAFLTHGWTATLDYSPSTMETALNCENTFKEFFLNVSDLLRGNQTTCMSKWSDEDSKLNEELMCTVNKVDAALCDNLDTRSALTALSMLVKECNKRQGINLALTRDIAAYIKHVLSIFGTRFDEINLDSVFASTSQQQQQSVGFQEAALDYVEALAQFRADVRRISMGSDAQQSIKSILSLCDRLRDQTLPELGVRLEDRESGDRPYKVKFVDAETLAQERAIAEKREEEAKLREETRRLEKLKLQQQRDEKAKLPPTEMFKAQSDKYSQFDDKGLPTHDADGKEISKSALKKLQRLYAEQETRYNKYMETRLEQS